MRAVSWPEPGPLSIVPRSTSSAVRVPAPRSTPLASTANDAVSFVLRIRSDARRELARAGPAVDRAEEHVVCGEGSRSAEHAARVHRERRGELRVAEPI